jgi:hypothetical protein
MRSFGRLWRQDNAASNNAVDARNGPHRTLGKDSQRVNSEIAVGRLQTGYLRIRPEAGFGTNAFNAQQRTFKGAAMIRKLEQ